MSNYNPKLEKKLNLWGYVLSVLVLLLIVSMRKIHINSSIDFHFLPPLYSSLNAISAITLIIAYWHIINKRIDSHKLFMILSTIISCFFLLGYVVYHITTSETKYCGEGSMRYVYFLLLISHIILAAVSFPFIVFTFIRGYVRNDKAHVRLAKWVFPIWLYVCLSGPLCYLMLRPCYNFAA